MGCSVAVFIRVRGALSGGVSRFSTVSVGAGGGIGTLRMVSGAAAVPVCMLPRERRFTKHEADHRNEND
jgi:hypothetical protein